MHTLSCASVRIERHSPSNSSSPRRLDVSNSARLHFCHMMLSRPCVQTLAAHGRKLSVESIKIMCTVTSGWGVVGGNIEFIFYEGLPGVCKTENAQRVFLGG